MRTRTMSLFTAVALVICLSLALPFFAQSAGAPTAPKITSPPTQIGPPLGLVHMVLELGYAATSSEAFTVTGNPEPTVTISTRERKITWNNATKRLDIAAGLKAGTYPVSLTASNGIEPDATAGFMLRVEQSGAPTIKINGSSSMTLAEGYEAVSSGTYSITGDPEPRVEITVYTIGPSPNHPDMDLMTKYSTNLITWNNEAKRLDIKPGLKARRYSVHVKVSNGKSPDATSPFSLTITSPGAPSVSCPGSSLQYDNRVFLPHMIVSEGYPKASTGVITITGAPAPTVAKTSGNESITWNNETKKLDIAPGLEVGNYQADFTVSNGVTPDAKFTFMLIVQKTGPGGNFEDVAEGDWFYDATAYMYGKGLMTGVSDTSFAPNLPLNRATIVTILYRHAGEPDVSGLKNTLADVGDATWYSDAVKWAANSGIVNGYADNTFRPLESVTNEQLAVLIYRTQQSGGKAPPLFDENTRQHEWIRVSSWAADEVSALHAQGVFRDIPDDVIDAKTPATRAAVASILYRYLTAITD